MDSIIFGFLFGSSFLYYQQKKGPKPEKFISVFYKGGGPYGIAVCEEIDTDRIFVCQCPEHLTAGSNGVKPGSELVWYGPINLRNSNLNATNVVNILKEGTHDVELKFTDPNPELISTIKFVEGRECPFWVDIAAASKATATSA